MEKQLIEITYQLNSLPKLFLDKRNSDELIAIEVGVGHGVYEEMYVTSRSRDSKVSLDCTSAWEQGSFLINIPVNKLYELLTTIPFHQFDSKILMDDYDWELLVTTDGDMTYNKVNDIDIENVDEVIESLKGTEYEIKQKDIESILGYEVSEEELSEEEKEELISYKMNDLYNGGDIDAVYVFDSLFYLKFNDQKFGEYYINWTYEEKELNDANEAFQKEEYERFLTTALKYLELTNQKLEYLIKSEQVESKELSKDVFDLILKISIAYEFVGKKEESAHYMNYYIQAGPTLDTRTYYFIGESFRKMKKFQEAIEQYLNCVNLQVDEYHVEAYESMGDCYFKLEDFENSAKYYSQAPRTSYNLYNVGISYRRMSNYSKAIEYFNLAIELDASYKWAYQFRGYSYGHLGEYSLAVKDFTKVIELDASYKWAYQFRGESYAQLGKNRLAVKDFTKVIELDASYEWAYQERGKIYFKLNKYKLAVKDFEKALELNASPEAWHYDLAFTYHFLGRYDEAVNWYEKLVGLSYKRYGYRKSLLLYYNIVTATKKVSPSLESEEVLLADTQDEHILEALLKRAETYYNYGFDELDTEFRLNDIDRILELDPKAYEAYYYRAIIFRDYRAQKFYSMEKAVEELKKCLEINRYVPALQLYARYVDDFDEGVSAIREAVTIEPDNASSWWTFGNILFNEDDFEGALEKYLKSNELNSDFCVLEITSTYTKLELYDLAIDVMYKHLAAHFQLSVSSGHGIAYEKLHEIFTLKYTSDEYKDVLKVLADFSYKNNQEGIAYLEEYEYQIQFDKRSIFSFLKFFKKGILKHFLEKGRYITKVHLLQNQDLDISFDLIKDIISTANYTVVEAAVAHRSVSVEVLDEIIDNDDNSYLYSYKLLGVLSNPNVLERQIERLKDNRFNWVRQKAYSITKELKDLDTTDRYVLLGLLNNPAAKESEATYKKLLETTSINIYTHKIEAGHVGIEEFSIHQLDFDKVVSVFSGENESQDYRTASTHLFSEYGITEFIDTILVCKNDDEEKIEIPSYLDELYRLDSSSKNFEGVSLEQVGEGFVQIRIDSGSGSMEFKSLEMEHEFRPEKLFPVYSHSGAIECYTYGNEKIEGKAVDFDLHTQIDDTYLLTENGLIFIDFEVIKDEMEELGIDIKDKNEVLHYFRKLLNGGLKK